MPFHHYDWPLLKKSQDMLDYFLSKFEYLTGLLVVLEAFEM